MTRCQCRGLGVRAICPSWGCEWQLRAWCACEGVCGRPCMALPPPSTRQTVALLPPSPRPLFFEHLPYLCQRDLPKTGMWDVSGGGTSQEMPHLRRWHLSGGAAEVGCRGGPPPPASPFAPQYVAQYHYVVLPLLSRLWSCVLPEIRRPIGSPAMPPVCVAAFSMRTVCRHACGGHCTRVGAGYSTLSVVHLWCISRRPISTGRIFCSGARLPVVMPVISTAA